MYPTEILKHAFFKDYDYESIKYKKIDSPFKKLIEENYDEMKKCMENKKEIIDLSKSKSKKKKESNTEKIDQGNNFNFIVFIIRLILKV